MRVFAARKTKSGKGRFWRTKTSAKAPYISIQLATGADTTEPALTSDDVAQEYESKPQHGEPVVAAAGYVEPLMYIQVS